MSSVNSQNEAVGRKGRGNPRVPSSTAKLDQILDGMRSGAERQLQLESSIDKLAESVHQLALSSVRYEEKVLQLENKTSKEIAVQGEQLKALGQKFESLEDVVKDLRSLVKDLEESRQSQKYWFRKVATIVLTPVIVAALGLLLWGYTTLREGGFL